MDDIRERDLSSKPESALTQEERHELKRRYKEFQALVKERGPKALGLSAPRAPLASPARTRAWDPRSMGRAAGKRG